MGCSKAAVLFSKTVFLLLFGIGAALSENYEECPSATYRFPRSGQTEDMVWYQGEVSAVSEVTICFWVRVANWHVHNTIVSYASRQSGNDIFVVFPGPTELAVAFGGKVQRYPIDDFGSYRNHMCVWVDTNSHMCGAYINGTEVLVQHHGGRTTAAGGSMILGQEQDEMNAGRLDEFECFEGTIGNVIFWPRVLGPEDVTCVHADCACPNDYVIAMTTDMVEMRGQVEEKIPKACPRGL